MTIPSDTDPAGTPEDRPGARQRTVDIGALIDASPLSGLQVRVIALCGLVSLIEGFDIQAMAFVAPVVGPELGIPAGALGSVFAAFLAGIAIGSVLIAPLADRIGRRWILICSSLLFGTFMLATFWCETVPELLVVRFLTGLGVGGAAVVVVPLASEYAPRRIRSTAVMAMLAGLPLGSVLGGVLSGWLIPNAGWRSVFLVGGIVSLVAALLLIVALPESIRFLIARHGGGEQIHRLVRRIAPELGRAGSEIRYEVAAEPAARRSPFITLFTQGRAITTVGLWIAMFAFQLVLYFLLSWIPSLLSQSGQSLSTAILGGTLFSVGGILGSLALGRLIDRTGRPVGVLCGASLIAVAAILTVPALLPAVGPAMAAIVVLGVGTIGTQIGIINLSGNTYPTLVRSTGVGWALGVGRIGSITGPVLGGVLIAGGWTTAELFTAVAVPASIGLVALLVLGLRSRRHAAPTT